MSDTYDPSGRALAHEILESESTLSDAFARLQELLRQLFQFDSADLDFGIYRIMNQKRGEIEGFVQDGLAESVEEALEGGAVARQAAQAEELRETTDRVKETFGEYAVDREGELSESFRETPLGKEYLEVRSRAGSTVDLEDLKAQIFNHVYTFFSRYYDDGDFLSKRRYSRRQKYAVPYNGEEVYLHWANADQYYIKTGEHFTDYRCKARNGVTIHFELAGADTEQNNVKGEKRFFVPRVKDAAYDEEARALTVPFEYRPLSAKEQIAYGTRNQQEKIVEEVTTDLSTRLKKQPEALAALEPAGELERHLRRYTRRNTSDFFVHKDLKGFLEGELDFYLKNEVLDVDDLEAWGPDRSDSWFEVMRAIKRIGRGIIAFLAQIEDFQKKLFEKKKLVVSAGYCMTLDRVPEELYPEVATSDAQREEWVRLFAIDGIEENLTEPGYSEPLTTDFLKANPHLVLDTKHFDEDFKDRLLASIEDLDEQTDGLLVESENFQALNLLQERYRQRLTTVFIDPPYNTGLDGFLYKDSYQHSSWLSMMENRLSICKPLLSSDATFFSTIDYVEVSRLRLLCDTIFGSNNFLADVAWEKRYTRSNNAKRFYSLKDTVLAYRSSETLERLRESRSEKSKANYTNPDNDPRGPWISSSYVNPARKEQRPNLVYSIKNPFTGKDTEHPTHAWKYDRETHTKHVLDDRLYWGLNSDYGFPRLKSFLSEVSEGMVPIDLWHYKETGTTDDGGNEVKALFGDSVFDNPKPTSLVRRTLQLDPLNGDGTIVFDFFAGSGTTGHAVIELNREDGGHRKYVLVEMGEYFASVLKPRIMKVIYSKDWKDGKPVSREGTSHAFKYLKLESYEDALDNIAFTHEREGQEALKLYGDDYLLHYMLDFETRGSASLLNVEKLAAPFRYRLRLRDGEEKRTVSVDLPETFAYLLGLRIRTRRVHHDDERRCLVYRGSTPERGEVTIIWRDTEGWDEADFERDKDFVHENGLVEGADEVFVNGDSFVSEARPLEGVFKQRMLAGPAVG